MFSIQLVPLAVIVLRKMPKLLQWATSVISEIISEMRSQVGLSSYNREESSGIAGMLSIGVHVCSTTAGRDLDCQNQLWVPLEDKSLFLTFESTGSEWKKDLNHQVDSATSGNPWRGLSSSMKLTESELVKELTEEILDFR